jgi:membrane-bound toxin of toxin-antitoxin system
MERAEILRIDLKPSLWLKGVLGAAHMLALVSVWASVDGWPRYLVAAGILLSGVGCLSEAMMRRGAVAVSLELHPDGRVSWRDRAGGWHETQLTGDHFVTVPLIVLGLRQGSASRKRIVLLRDSAPADELRRLRAWLRLKPEGDPNPRKPSIRPRNPPAS